MTWTLILDILFLFRKQMCMFPSLPKRVMIFFFFFKGCKDRKCYKVKHNSLIFK